MKIDIVTLVSCCGMFDIALGAFLLYLASPAQRAVAKPPASRTCLWIGLALIAGGLFLLRFGYGSATLFFVAATVLMLILSLLPIGVALLCRRSA